MWPTCEETPQRQSPQCECTSPPGETSGQLSERMVLQFSKITSVHSVKAELEEKRLEIGGLLHYHSVQFTTANAKWEIRSRRAVE